MSGQKDVLVQSISNALLAQQRERERALEEQRRRIAAAQAQIADELTRAHERAAAAEKASREYARRLDDVSGQLEQATIESKQAAKRLAAVKKHIEEAEYEARAVHSEIVQEGRRIEDQLKTLTALEQELKNSLKEIQRQQETHNGSEALQAMRETQQLTEKHAELTNEASAVDAQLTAFATSNSMGTIIYELLEASREHGYTVTRSFTSPEQAELLIKNDLNETIRIAYDLSREKAEALTENENLRLVLHGENHESEDLCIADTVKILDSLRKRGVGVVLSVEADTGDQRRPGLAQSAAERDRRRE
jgi:chromosome segregation ATPase